MNVDIQIHNTCWCYKCLLVALLLMSQNLAARYFDEDSEHVDSELPMGSETFNDEISYRFSVRNQRLWRLNENVLQVGAGSYSATRFQYIENLKLQSQPKKSVVFGLKRLKNEDAVESKLDQYLSVSGDVFSSFTWEIRGDGGSEKAKSDVGAGIGAKCDYGFLKFFYWSTDHYFNSKTLDEDVKYSKTPSTVESVLSVSVSENAWVELKSEIDARTDKVQISTNENLYSYQFNRTTLEYDIELLAHTSIVGFVQNSFKREEKNENLNMKSLVRNDIRWDVGIYHSLGFESRDYTGIHVGHVWRDVKYEYTENFDVESESFEPSVTRKESYLDYYRSTSLEDSSWEYGVILNRIFRWEDELKKSNYESKFKLSWSYLFSEAAQIVLNTTWDIDQLQRDFPYRSESFKPWGGGNIQFHAVF